MPNKIWGHSFGYHYTVDGSKCDVESLKSFDKAQQFIAELLTIYSAYPIMASGYPNVFKYSAESGALSIHQALITGMISVYTHPDDASIYFDMMIDRSFNPEPIIDMLSKHFGMSVLNSNYMRRQANLTDTLTGNNEDDIIKQINMSGNITFKEIFEQAVPGGLYLEFGVAEGKSIREMGTEAPDKKIYGFDSFEGLPEDWKSDGDMLKGAFACDVPTDLPPNVELVVGLFQDTLENWAKEHPGHLSVIHLDADLYSSTDYVMRTLEDRFVDGTIIVFDEIHGHPDHREHEYRNFLEFLERTGFKWECLGQRTGEAAAFKIYK